MTEEAIDLDQLILADKQTQKKTNNKHGGNGGNRRNNNNDNSNNGEKEQQQGSYEKNDDNDDTSNNNSGKRIFINRNNKPQNKENNKQDRQRNNSRKYSGRDDRNESLSDSDRQVKKVHKQISKNRADDTDPQQLHPPRQLQVSQAKKVNMQKKIFVVKVQNLQCNTPPYEIYELASQNGQVEVQSISIQFNCAEDSKLIEAEITYLNKADAEKFIKNYNEATLDDKELKIYLL